MTTATELSEARRERAIDTYQREHRFRSMVQHIVHMAMKERDMFAADEVTLRPRDLADMFTDVAAQVLKMVYEEDAELARLVAERDSFKKVALDTIALKPPLHFIAKPDEAP